MDKLYCDNNYEGIVKETIHQYKFLGDVALADVLAAQIRLPNETFDFIVPIPSPFERDYQRTFNPVREVLRAKKVNYTEMLSTIVRPKQSSLSKMVRAQAQNPFKCTTSLNIAGKSVLLVDDIYTTGLTVHHAASLLYIRKVRKLGVLTFAR
ncbi:ComF family protein [Staphylococcus marylandisciuri]|nr:phosphoribosyltransferase family protein [Staphylococcus marylandisciuri]